MININKLVEFRKQKDEAWKNEQSSSATQSKLVIDFNYAYNPYSSYNDNWDCPITPEENILPVAIRAGEKKFL